jgi:voltage-gated potassium channel
MERLYRALALFAAVLAGGTMLFRTIEHLDWFDCFYATLLSITPLGHGLMPELSRAGRELNSFLLVCGVGVVGYAASIATRFVFEGELGRVFWRRRVRNRVNAMEGHYLLCGHGRVGRIVAEELERHGVAFVIVELAEEAVAERVARGEDVVVGDATDEKVLESAGVRRAKGLVAALQSDADNLYVTLTAREMNPKIRIVARATDDAAAAKLKRAGADRTISPNVIGGREMAQHLLMPAVVDFIHLATGKQNLDLEMREIHVRDRSRLCGVPFAESPIRREHGVIVVAINRSSGESVFNPDSSFVVGANDVLICLGRPEHLAAMQKLAELGS